MKLPGFSYQLLAIRPEDDGDGDDVDRRETNTSTIARSAHLKTNQPTIYFPQIKSNIANNIANNSGRLPEKPYGSMNWSPM